MMHLEIFVCFGNHLSNLSKHDVCFQKASHFIEPSICTSVNTRNNVKEAIGSNTEDRMFLLVCKIL